MECVKIHFLNVGHGDCTFIEHASGRLSMIDINNSKSLPFDDEIALAAKRDVSLDTFRGRNIIIAKGQMSWEEYYRRLLVDPLDYYNENFPGKTIFRYIQTHPDMDHMGGLHRFFWQEGVDVQNVWDTLHSKAFEEKDFDNSPHHYEDWLVYCLMRVGGLSNGRSHKVVHPGSGDTASYWFEDGLQIWGPNSDLVQQCNDLKAWNNSSFVLRLEYGGRSLVLPGDAEEAAWEAVAESVGGDNMKCDILKAAHHGRNSGYSDMAVDAMSPEIVICSVGKKPFTDASHKYSAHGATVLSTRSKGTIVVKIWADGEVEVFDHNSDKIGGLPILHH